MQLPPEQEDEEGKWLVSAVAGQGFAFVVDDDQGVLPADAGTFVPLPVLIRSAWRQQAFLYERKILSVLDVRELLASSPDEIHFQAVSPHLAHLDTGEGLEGFATAFGQEQVEILEFSLYTMIHALPGAQVEDILPFTHCQRLTGTRGLILGVTLYKEELLPVLDPARCFGRDSNPTADWQLLLVCNGELRGLVLVEKVLGRRMLAVHEQRMLPFAAPRSSVYGCYPVVGRVGLILNILALTAYFDDEQARELFLFADELLPDETEEQVVEEGSEGEESLLENDFLGWKEKDPEALVTAEEPLESSLDTDELEKGASTLLVDDPDSLVQSVVASMLTRKSSESERSGESDWPENEEDAGESDDIFSSVVAAMFSQQENDLDIDAEPVSHDGQGEEKAKDSAPAVLQEDNRPKEQNDPKDQKEQERGKLSETKELKEPQVSFEAPSVLLTEPGLLTEKQEELLRSDPLASFQEEENQEVVDPVDESPPNISVPSDSLEQVIEPIAEPTEPLSSEEKKTFSEEGTLVFSEDTAPSSEAPPFEEKSDDETQEDESPLLILTEEQNALLQSSLAAAFTGERNKEPAKGGGAEELVAESEKQGVVAEKVIPPSEEDQQGQQGQQDRQDGQEDKLEQDIRFDRQSDASRGSDQTGHAVVFEEKDVAEEGESKHEKKGRADDIQQPEKAERTSSEIDTWNVLEDTSSFPELKEFAQHVSKIQQGRSSLKMPHADFVQQVKFPALSSPDPRKIKEQLDRARKKERDLLFRNVAHDLAEGSQGLQPEDKKNYRLRRWLFLLLLIIFLGLQVWYFAFQNQDVPRGKNIEFTTSMTEFPERTQRKSDSSPAIQHTQPEQDRENKADGKTSEQRGSTLEEQGVIGREIETGAVDQPEPYLHEKDGENRDQQEAGDPQTSGQGKGISSISTKAPDSLPEQLVQGRLHDKALPENSESPDEAMTVVESTEDVLGMADDVADLPDAVTTSGVQEEEGIAKGNEKEVTKEQSSEKKVTNLFRKKGQEGQNRTAPKDAQAVKGSQYSEVTSEVAGQMKDQQEAGDPQTSGQGKVISTEAPDSSPERLVQGRLHDKALSENSESPDDVMTVADVADKPDVVTTSDVQEGEGIAKENEKEVKKKQSSEKRAMTLLRKIGQGRQNRTVSKDAQDVEGSQRSEIKDQIKIEQIEREEGGKKEEKERKKLSDHGQHTVNKGDTLWGISEQYTGSGFNYLDVANKNKITNPDLIYPDQQVTLPDPPVSPVQK